MKKNRKIIGRNLNKNHMITTAAGLRTWLGRPRFKQDYRQEKPTPTNNTGPADGIDIAYGQRG